MDPNTRVWLPRIKEFSTPSRQSFQRQTIFGVSVKRSPFRRGMPVPGRLSFCYSVAPPLLWYINIFIQGSNIGYLLVRALQLDVSGSKNPIITSFVEYMVIGLAIPLVCIQFCSFHHRRHWWIWLI